MSASAPFEPLDYSEQVARIERAQAETRKFVAEQNKLAAEQGKLNEEGLKLIEEARKLNEEARKLSAEERKLKRDRALAPLILVASLAGVASGVIGALVSHYLR